MNDETTIKPKYEHDCEDCLFLGQTLGHGKIIDLYAHKTKTHVTLIARYSDEGRDYYSIDYNYVLLTGHAELFVAKFLYDNYLNELESDINASDD